MTSGEVSVAMGLCLLGLVALQVAAYVPPSTTLPPAHDMNFMPAPDLHDPLRFRHEMRLGSVDRPQAALRYDVRLAPHAVALSQIPSIHSMHCTADSLVMTVDDSFFATSGYLGWKENHIFNGGKEFGCKDEKGVINIVMRTMDYLEVSGNTVTIWTKGKAEIEHFFEHAEVAFYSVQGARPVGFDEQFNNPKNEKWVNEDGSVSMSEGGIESFIAGQKPEPVSEPKVPDFAPRGYNKAAPKVVSTSRPRTQAFQQQPSRAQGADFAVQSGSAVTVNSPAYKDSYNAGDTITLSWDYQGYSAATGVKVRMMKERWLVWDETIQEMGNVAMSSGAAGMTVSTQAAWQASERYYFLLEWDCGWFSCSSQQSPYFLVPEIKITYPTTDSQFHPGDTVEVTWMTFNNKVPASTQLKLTVYQEKPFWPDAKLADTFNTPNDGSESITIPPDTEIQLWPYYIELEWNCLIFGQFCDYATSDRFTLPGSVAKDWNYDASTGRAIEPISMISLGCGNLQMACAGTPIGGAGSVGDLGGLSADDHARARRFRQMGIVDVRGHPADSPILELESHDNHNLRRARNQIEKDSNLPASVTELFGPGSANHARHRAETQAYQSEADPARNLRVKRRKGESPVTLMTYASLVNSYRKAAGHIHALDQEPCGPTGGSDMGAPELGFPGGLLGEICNLCKGASTDDMMGTMTQAQKTFDIELSCSNCWYKYEYTVAKFELIKSGTKVESLIVDLQGTAQVNIELMLKIHYRQTFSLQRRLFDLRLYGWSFSVAGISIELGAFLSLDFKFDLTFDLTGKMSMEGGANAAFSGKLQYGTQYPAARLDSGHTFTYNTYRNKPKITVDASVVIKVSFIPMLRFTFFGILTFKIYIEPYVEWTSLFNWPGFPPLSDAPEPAAIRKFPNDCTSPHYFQFLVAAGLGSIMLQVELDFKLPVLDKFHIVLSYAIPLPYDRVPLISGCWLAPKSVATNAVTVNTEADLSTVSAQNIYEYRVQQEVANAVGVDQERVNVGQIQVDPDAQTTTVEVGFSSQLENGQGDPPGPVVGSFPRFIPRIASMLRPFVSAFDSAESSYWRSLDSTGGDDAPPQPDWTDDAPDTRSAQTLSTQLKNAVNDPNSALRRQKSVFAAASAVNALQTYNPADGNTVSLFTPNSGLDGPSFGYGFLTVILLCLFGLFVRYAAGRYKERVEARSGLPGYTQLSPAAANWNSSQQWSSNSTSASRFVNLPPSDHTTSGAGSYRPVELSAVVTSVPSAPAKPSVTSQVKPSTASAFRPISPVTSSNASSSPAVPPKPTPVRPPSRQNTQSSLGSASTASTASTASAPRSASPVNRPASPASPTHKKTGSQDLRPASPQRNTSPGPAPMHKKTGSQDLRPASPQRNTSPGPIAPVHKRTGSGGDSLHGRKSSKGAFCTNCGRPFGGPEKFCIHCGTARP